MVDTLALECLFDDVVASYTAEGLTIPHTFGWREATKQHSGNRIVWQPGDVGGTAGTIESAIKPGRNPRPLATLKELFTVYVTGRDTSSPENERLQWKAARLLFDDWLRHVHYAAFGRYEIVSVRWDQTKNERRAGATLVVVGTIQSMIPDAAGTETGTDISAEIAITELDITETPVYTKDGYGS